LFDFLCKEWATIRTLYFFNKTDHGRTLLILFCAF
jgi:hypothetical protein